MEDLNRLIEQMEKLVNKMNETIEEMDVSIKNNTNQIRLAFQAISNLDKLMRSIKKKLTK